MYGLFPFVLVAVVFSCFLAAFLGFALGLRIPGVHGHSKAPDPEFIHWYYQGIMDFDRLPKAGTHICVRVCVCVWLFFRKATGLIDAR